MKFPSTLRWSALFLVVGLLALGWWQAGDTHTQRTVTVARVIDMPAVSAAMEPVEADNPAPPSASSPVPLASAQPAPPASAPRGRPSDALIAASRVAVERWSQPDPRGDRERVAILHADHFKYPLLRVVERWSGKNGQIVSRIAMVADHILIAPKAGTDPKLLEERLAAAGFAVRGREPGSFVLVSFADAITDPDELPRRIEALGAWQDVLEFAEPDHLVWPCVEPNDPAYTNNKLWGLHNRGGVSGYVAGADISAPEGWDILHDAPNVIVAITDTGIRYDHQDLAPNMWHNPGETPGDGIDNDGNGVIDDVFGYNAVDNNGDPMDDQGHGSHCAGTIGASGSNGTGLCGVAWKVQLMASRFLGAEGGTTSDGIKAINYARRMGAHVISASWGGGPYSEALYQAIAACAQANIPFIAAAGNDGVDNDSDPHYPSSYDLSNIVAVAATDATDHLTDFSCYGRNSVDIAAPGWQIFSSFSGGTTDYRFLDGTSMATPHVSGAMALARARFPNDSAEDLISRLYQSADVLPALENRVATGGRLNLARLLGSAGQIQPNDSFDTPCVFVGDYGTWNGSNATATREADEDSWSPVPGSRTLWFAWQAGFEGWADFSFRSLSTGLRLVVYRGDTRGNLTVCADTGAAAMSDKSASCRFQTVAGANYRMVAVSDSATGERFSLAFSVTGVNDLISCATPITGAIFDIAGTNRGATAEPFESRRLYLGVGGGRTVWYRWTAPTTGPFSINTEGSGIDTVLGVYTGDPLKPESLTEIAVSDDHDALLTWSDVRFTAVAGTTYYLSIDSYYNASTGAFQLHGIIPGPPQIMAQPVAVEVPLGGRAVFSVGATGSRTLLYQWFRGTEAIPGAWDRTLVVDPVKESNLGGYHVTVRNGFGTCTSATAMLTEKQMPPTIVWTSGNQAVAPSTPVALKVRAQGTAPLTYQWSRDNVPIGGATGDTLTFDSAQVADAGIYTCTVSNSKGSAQVSLELAVVPSPWQRWQWRRDCVPNAPITDLKVIDDRCIAVAGDRLLVSDDGHRWQAVMLPENFNATSVAKLDGTWLCVGTASDTRALVSKSSDGLVWSTPVAPTGVLPGFDNNYTELQQVEAFAGRFVAWRVSSGGTYELGGIVHYSSDGIAWTPATASFLNGTTGTLYTSKCRLASGGGIMVIPSPSPNSSSYVMRSSDGVNWTEIQIGGTGSGAKLAFYTGGQWHVFCRYSYCTSPDGLQWQETSAPSNSWGRSTWVVDLGAEVAGFNAGTQEVLWGPWSAICTSTPWQINSVVGQNFSAATAFHGGVVFGTKSGFLGYAASRRDLKIPSEFIGNYEGLSFLNGEFIASGTNASLTTPGSILLSGDALRWQAASDLGFKKYRIMGFGGDRYYVDNHQLTHVLCAGFAPETIAADSITMVGWSGNSVSIADNGTTILAITVQAGSGSSVIKLMRSMDRGKTWAAVATAPAVGEAQQVQWCGNRWFLPRVSGSWTETDIYSSDDGLTWTQATAVKATHIAKLGTKWYGVRDAAEYGTTTKGWESSDGISWSVIPLTGLPSSRFTMSKLVTFNGNLVARVRWQLTIGGPYIDGVFYSPDGKSWFRGSIPAGLVDIESALGKLVAVTSYGALIETGALHPGGGAPLIRVDYPAPVTSQVQGSWFEVAGSCTDPEGSPTTLGCYVDGVLVDSQAAAGDFRFRLRVTNPNGHTVRLRAVDAAGLVVSKTLRVKATPAQLSNLLDSGEGKTFLPRTALVEFAGALYAAGGYMLWRSIDGLSWERVLLPSTDQKVYGMAAGNGTLVLQFATGQIVSSRDGINWSSFQPNIAGYTLASPVRFSAGWFSCSFNTGSSTGTVVLSQDGLVWNGGTISQNGNVAWSAVNEQGVMLAASQYSGGLKLSTDFSNNWLNTGPFDNTSYSNSNAAYGNGRFVFIYNGNSWWSCDGITWTASAPVPNAKWICFTGGRFFVRNASNCLFMVSEDGLTWQTLQGESLLVDDVVFAAGVFVGRGPSGMVWSADAVTWQKAGPGPQGTLTNRLTGTALGFHLVDTNGGLWQSPDGKTWTATMPGHTGTSTSTVACIANEIVAHNQRLLVCGSGGMLRFSDDQGHTWVNATVDGALLPNNRHFWRMVSNGREAFAIHDANLYIGLNQPVLIRTTDGATWTTVALPAEVNPRNIRDIASDGFSWIAVGEGAMALRSEDGGASWVPVTIPGPLNGLAIARFQRMWIVIGKDAASSTIRIVTSEDGNAWTPRGTAVLEPSYILRNVQAHDRLIFWQQGKNLVASMDGIVWSQTSIPAAAGNHDFDIASTSSGWLAIQDASSTSMWTSPPQGDVWTSIPLLQYNVSGVGNLGSRLFLFGTGFIQEWTENDLGMDGVTAPAVTLGVGDALNCTATVRNLGSEAVTADLSVDGWLSPDGFFGDGNDIYLGRVPLGVAIPAPGVEATANLSFVLPDTIRPGDMRLIIKLDPDEKVYESNQSNNVAITRTALVTIPQWQLNVVTNGNGSVSASQVGEYYPHKARVSFMARAGKGARFAGWGGDALGSLSESMVVLDSNKTVIGNFVSTTNLVAYVRGGGTVSSDAEGGAYVAGATASLQAVALPGWMFSGWSGDLTGTTAAATLAMDTNKIVTATFTLTREAWTAREFSAADLTNPLVSGPDADPDNDGMANWREWLRGSPPKDAAARGYSNVTREGRWLLLTYTRLETMPAGYAVRCVAATDLTNWTLPVVERVVASSAGVETIEARLDTTGLPQAFIRTIDEGPATTDPYEAWRATAFSAADLALSNISGRTADPDIDGAPNWREWLSGSLPQDRTSTGLLGMRRDGGTVVLTFTRLRGLPAGYVVHAACTTNLTDWTTVGVVETVISTAGGVDTIEARWTTSGSGYMRVEFCIP